MGVFSKFKDLVGIEEIDDEEILKFTENSHLFFSFCSWSSV